MINGMRPLVLKGHNPETEFVVAQSKIKIILKNKTTDELCSHRKKSVKQKRMCQICLILGFNCRNDPERNNGLGKCPPIAPPL